MIYYYYDKIAVADDKYNLQHKFKSNVILCKTLYLKNDYILGNL